MKDHTDCNWECACWGIFGILLWVAALITLVYAWFATSRGEVLGQVASFWFMNALILGVLAIPLRSHSNSSCNGTCATSASRKRTTRK